MRDAGLDTLRAIDSLRGRAKAMPTGHAYEIESRPGQYGLDVVLPQDVRLDESRMGIWIPFADGNKRDGVGDLLEVEGIDLSRHQANPIVLFDHGKKVALPVATASDPDTGAYTVAIDAKARTAGAMAYFYQGKGMAGVGNDAEYAHAQFCEQLYDLMVKKFVRGGSIGYTVVSAREIPADWERGIPKGLHLLRVKMLELSSVVLPCNQSTVGKSLSAYSAMVRDTARRILSMGKVCGKPLSPYLVKSLTPLAGGAGAHSGPAPAEVDEAQALRKSILEIRAKYKTPRGVLHRLKKGSPGAAVFYVREKDVAAARREAERKGITVKWAPAGDGLYKAHATGADAGIDVLAKRFAQPRESPRSSGMSEVKKKALGAVADAAPGVDPTTGAGAEYGTGDAPGGDVDDAPVEPYGAQVLRRLHDDHSMLMKDYHDMLGPLEKDDVKKLVTTRLGDMERHLGEIEKMFKRHYKELPALINAAGDSDPAGGDAGAAADPVTDADTDADAPPVGDSDAPPVGDADGKDADTMDDEAVGGGTAGRDDPPTGREAYEASTEETPPDSAAVPPERPPEDEEGEEDEDGKKKAGEKSFPKGVKSHECDCGKVPCECGPAGGGGDFAEHEKSYVGEASGFLKELADPASDLDDEGRMKSYHYHKTLGGIVEARARAAEGEKSAPGGPEWEEGGSAEPRHRTECDAGCKAIGEASGFFKKLSTERAFGDRHRGLCGEMAKALDGAMGQGPEQPPEEAGGGGDPPGVVMEEDGAAGGDAPYEPGQMDEKLLLEVAAQRATFSKAIGGLLERLSR